MLNQLIPDPLLTFDEVRVGLAIAGITCTFLYVIILYIRVLNESTNIKLRKSLMFVLHGMITVGLLLIFFEITTLKIFDLPEDFSWIVNLILLPSFFFFVWLLIYFPLQFSKKRQNFVIRITISWYSLLWILYPISKIWWKAFLEVSLNFAIIMIIIGTISSVRLGNTFFYQKSESLSFYTDKNYGLAGIGSTIIILFPIISVALNNIILFDFSYIIYYTGLLIGLSFLIISLTNEVYFIKNQTESKYNKLLNDSEAGVIVSQIDQSISIINNKARRMLHFSTDDHKISSEDFKERISSKDRKIVDKYLQTIFLEKRETSDGIIFQTINKNWIHIKAIYSELSQELFIYLWDITNEKSLEDVKNRFVAITSHELRTPVTILRGYNELLLNRKEEFNKEFMEKILKINMRNIVRLENLIENVHDLSMIDAKVFKIKKQPVSIDDLYKEIQDQVSLLYPERLILFNILNYNNQMMNIDLSRIIQVVFNLISNAVKHSSNISIIRLSIIVTDELKLVIEDEGNGIPLNIFFQIGQPFIHKDSSYSVKGTGLGLFIVKNITLNHGGILEYYSRETEGTTFAITIPLTDFE